jgi:DNA topoisomerase I
VLALADKSASISARQLQARGRSDSELRVEEQRLLSFLRRSAHSRARQARSAAEQRRASN